MMAKIEGETVISKSWEPTDYVKTINEHTFDELIELFGEDHLITALIAEVRRLRKALEEIIKLETTPIDETERSQEWRSVGWADAAAIARSVLEEGE
jgi:hypothetical protein